MIEQRPLKYRAWDIRNKVMVPDACVLTPTRNLVTVNEEHFNSPFSFFDGCVWLQFTGHVDTNGVDIYEGDYLKQTVNDVVVDSKLEVKWSEGAFYLFNCNEMDEDYKVSHAFPLNYAGTFEVWGNKYENAEVV